jgi:hypothetical protein
MATASVERIGPSLLRAAEALEQAHTGAEVRLALREGFPSLEYHLDTLARELARDPGSPGALDPALHARAVVVEAELRGLLVRAWRLGTHPDVVLDDLTGSKALARAIRNAQHQDMDLVIENLTDRGALD